MDVRSLFGLLEHKYGKTWRNHGNVNIIFLMILIRLADLLHIDASRTDKIKLELGTIYSPVSLNEHEKHLAIKNINLNGSTDGEKMILEVEPLSAKIYVEIESLVKYIQQEFDRCWAIMGEECPDNLKLKYRRIETNITDEMKDNYKFVPKRFCFKLNDELAKLLISPLYGNNPSYGVREMVSNAVDACRARFVMDDELDDSLTNSIRVKVNFYSLRKVITIVDEGIGMTIDEIEKYFLNIGASFNNDSDWQKNRKGHNVYRTGRFGIGILAAFLIGPKITVSTRSIKDGKDGIGYKFTATLDKKFIQIDKVEGLDIGTTIEIECSDDSCQMLANEAIERLNGDNDSINGQGTPWFDWYVESKPIVEYYMDNILIKKSSNPFKNYKTLEHSCEGIGSILWKPASLFKRYGNRKLFCNGFVVTQKSNNTEFHLEEIEKYPIRIPSLSVIDLYNKLPLNIQRNDIDEKWLKKPLEEELATAMYKDMLCQLMAIDINQSRTLNKLFISDMGFTYNKYALYPLRNYYSGYKSLNIIDEFASTPYNEYWLKDKILVHICDTGRFDYLVLKDLSKQLSQLVGKEVLCTLHSIPYDPAGWSNIVDLIYIIKSIVKLRPKKSLIKDCSIAVYKEILDVFSYPEDVRGDISFIKNRIRDNDNKRINDYCLINHRKMNDEIVKSLSGFLHDNENRVGLPLFFILHHVSGEPRKDGFAEQLFDEYGGDMIFPFDEEERKKKFSKIYEECKDDIELYKKEFRASLYKP